MVLLDTHVVVWLYAGLVGKLSDRAVQAIENNDLCASVVTRLELQYLFEISRIAVEPDRILEQLRDSIGLNVAEFRGPAVFARAAELAWTRDLFDRLICAESLVGSIPLITRDRTIRQHLQAAIW